MSSGYVLVVDDEPDIRDLVQEILEDEGYQVAIAENGVEAKEKLRLRRPDVLLLDIWMPDIDGITILKQLTENDQELSFPVIMMSGHGTIETAVESTRLGAYDFLEKPLSLAKLLLTIEHALSAYKLDKENHGLKQQLYAVDDPIGKSDTMNKLRNDVVNIANHDTCVLFTGEVGCGKSKFARYLHRNSNRKNGPFIDVGVAGLNKETLIKELFGCEEKGKVKYGLIEQANNGILYIDDISELDLFVQGRLLYLLEKGEIYRVNGEEAVAVNCRIIATCRYNLDELVRAEKFRSDLFYQLGIMPVHIPPLRSHREDIPELLNHYRDRFVQQNKFTFRSFSIASINRLRNYEWLGNLLELKNTVQSLLISSDEEVIEMEEVDSLLLKHQQTNNKKNLMMLNPLFEIPLKEAREQFEKSYLEYRLSQEQGSVGKVAQFAGVERTHLYRKIRSLGINVKTLTHKKSQS
ncbi:MAG: sigma-54 dependent transcriptional regulator [Pseudomonadota bacterium]